MSTLKKPSVDLTLEVLKRTLMFGKFPNWATVEFQLKRITGFPVQKDLKPATLQVEGRIHPVTSFKCSYLNKPYKGLYNEALRFLRIEEVI